METGQSYLEIVFCKVVVEIVNTEFGTGRGATLKSQTEIMLHSMNDGGFSPVRLGRVSVYSSTAWLAIRLSGWVIINCC